jgi:hypothetical protein
MLRRTEGILPLKGQATRMGRTFGAQDSIHQDSIHQDSIHQDSIHQDSIQMQRLRVQSPQVIRSPEGAASPNSPALQGRVLEGPGSHGARNISY